MFSDAVIYGAAHVAYCSTSPAKPTNVTLPSPAGRTFATTSRP